MMLVKMLLTGTSFATGFVGGPIFPLLFIGGTLGQVLSEILTFIPQGVGVLAGLDFGRWLISEQIKQRLNDSKKARTKTVNIIDKIW